MTAAQVVETSVTANITWDLGSAAGENRRGKKRFSGPLGSLRSRTFFGCFLATEAVGPSPMSTTVKGYAHADDHNEITPGFKIFSVPSLSRVYSEAPLIFTRLTFTVLVFSFVKHAPDKNQTPSSDEGK